LEGGRWKIKELEVFTSASVSFRVCNVFFRWLLLVVVGWVFGRTASVERTNEQWEEKSWLLAVGCWLLDVLVGCVVGRVRERRGNDQGKKKGFDLLREEWGGRIWDGWMCLWRWIDEWDGWGRRDNNNNNSILLAEDLRIT